LQRIEAMLQRKPPDASKPVWELKEKPGWW
jgi:hypothetical protein